MDALLPLLIGLVLGAAIATIVTAAVWRARTTSATAVADARVEGMREQLDSARGMYAELLQRTEAEARQRSAALTDENRVLQALAPVSESLEQMRAKVAELEGQRSRQHGEIAEQLRHVTASEERLRQTAEGLAGALRNNATRGVWGETQLRAVVEAAGMLEHVNFDLQSTISVDGRTARPDMIVRLPGGKSIAVDSKVPFSAYLEASAIPETADDAERARRASLLAQHVKAVRDHVTALGARRYWDGLESSPEMVVAFIPSESLLSAALEADPSIMQFAFDRHVALASPVTLFSVLKAVAVSWRHEIVTQEARTLFDVSRELYGRITTLATHVDKLGRSLERSVRDYNGFVGSLERQVLPSARRLSQLDETKVLAPVGELDADVRQLAASELIESLEADAATSRSIG
ncbi:DNA recombination protein RmuC [Salinibacterium sp. ZJ70]|uniref:DNA recombination protein RmuC n=1 Tax=Salinibacterium sp. ZJ70 TaxID=2708084 RepID=UPI0014243C07|nr:DNA recombination protein RmuC [Salinibacterium sp. ZJ70]